MQLLLPSDSTIAGVDCACLVGMFEVQHAPESSVLPSGPPKTTQIRNRHFPLPEQGGLTLFQADLLRRMADNPAPEGWEQVQLVWQPREAALRDRRDDERTVLGDELVHSKFIVATPIGVSGRHSIRTRAHVLTHLASSRAAGRAFGRA